MSPKVTAIVSTYNAEKLIERCIANLLEQSLREQLEIIIINSGSEQNEEQILKPYIELHPQIKYLRTDRETLYAAWNRAIQMASGEYLINANTDDLSFPEAFAAMATRLDAQPEQALLYTDYYVTNDPSDDVTLPPPAHWYRIDAPEYSHKELLLNCFCGPRPMWRRKLHQELGYFDDSLRYAGDYEFWLRIAERYTMVALHSPLHLYLDNTNGLWSTLRDTNEEQEIRRKYLSVSR